jgi:hypothetical protein
MSRAKSRFLRRHAALPDDHGSWVFLLSPLVIGLAAGGRWHTVSTYLVVAVLAGFLIRQPITLAIKVASGRRPRESLPAAFFWMAVYAGVGLLHVAGLVARGHGYVLWLAAAGVPIFALYLLLVARRAERRQLLVEVAATGFLALSAPAGLWVGLGGTDPVGWLLWALTWAQSAASLVHAYMRLEQRGLASSPGLSRRLRMGRGAVAFTGLNLGGVLALALAGVVPGLLVAPYGVQAAETVAGMLRPARGQKPKAIGRRQLLVSILFTVLFVVAWRS